MYNSKMTINKNEEPLLKILANNVIQHYHFIGMLQLFEK